LLRFICDKEQTLKEFTDTHCAQASFYFNTLLKTKEIKINGKKTGCDVPLSVGDEVVYFLTQKQAEKRAFHLVYEDENLLIIDKESGVNAEAVFCELFQKEGGRCAFIHRLDRNTAGLMAFARNKITEEALLLAFKEKRVEKKYHALCFGRFHKPQDTLVAYLKKDEKNAIVKIFNEPIFGAEKIITEYKVIDENADTTKVEVILHTGKTHQIRAHLAHIGCPIVGDMKYGKTEQNKAKKATRQQLVAKSLAFSMQGGLAYLNGKIFQSRFEI